MKRLLSFGLLISILFGNTARVMSNNADDKAKNIHQHHYTVQFAGNIGIFSFGIANRIFRDKAFVGVMYGYLPKSINDSEVHTLALKFGYFFYKRNLPKKFKLESYIGTGINYSITKNTYITYPDCFPKDYYKPNAIHLAPFIGIQLCTQYMEAEKQSKWICFYFEVATLDDYLCSMINAKGAYFKDIWNIALGLSVDID